MRTHVHADLHVRTHARRDAAASARRQSVPLRGAARTQRTQRTRDTFIRATFIHAVTTPLYQ